MRSCRCERSGDVGIDGDGDGDGDDGDGKEGFFRDWILSSIYCSSDGDDSSRAMHTKEDKGSPSRLCWRL